MERRNWSLKIYNKLIYIDSLDNEKKASALKLWVDNYLDNKFLDRLDLTSDELSILSELFYKNINFLKQNNQSISNELKQIENIKKFIL